MKFVARFTLLEALATGWREGENTICVPVSALKEDERAVIHEALMQGALVQPGDGAPCHLSTFASGGDDIQHSSNLALASRGALTVASLLAYLAEWTAVCRAQKAKRDAADAARERERERLSEEKRAADEALRALVVTELPLVLAAATADEMLASIESRERPLCDALRWHPSVTAALRHLRAVEAHNLSTAEKVRDDETVAWGTDSQRERHRLGLLPGWELVELRDACLFGEHVANDCIARDVTDKPLGEAIASEWEALNLMRERLVGETAKARADRPLADWSPAEFQFVSWRNDDHERSGIGVKGSSVHRPTKLVWTCLIPV